MNPTQQTLLSVECLIFSGPSLMSDPYSNPRPVKATPLSQGQIKHLKALGHGLKPLVLVGQQGLTQGVVDELLSTLEHHELVKVRLSGEDRDERLAMAESLAGQTGAQIVQRIGHVVLLFRRNLKKPKVALPS
jgi:RNA-binding protein